MRTLQMLFVVVALFVAGCEDSEPRQVVIVATSPSHLATTASRLRFGLLVEDTYNQPQNIVATVNVDKRHPASRCTYEAEEHNRIDADATRKQYVFWCEVDTKSLSAGFHTADFRIRAPSGDESVTAAKSVTFQHNPDAPTITAASVQREGDNTVVRWMIAGSEDGIEMVGYINGVRLFSSVAQTGLVSLSNGLAPVGSVIELVAYDAQRNEARRRVVVP